jgi:neurofibromin 1
LEAVADTLLQLLEELARPHKALHTHPEHVLHSELYILHLLADCCLAHWNNINLTGSDQSFKHERGSDLEDPHFSPSSRVTSPKLGQSPDIRNHIALGIFCRRYSHHLGPLLPKPLDEVLVGKMLDCVKRFLNPVAENYILPASHILDDEVSLSSQIQAAASNNTGNGQGGPKEGVKLLEERSESVELHTRTIIEFLSASNWTYVLEHLKLTLRGIRTAYLPLGAAPGVQTLALTDDDRNALITLRLIASLWVDARKLGVVIQELCSSFLHLRKHFQNTIAIMLPLLITRWLEQHPEEFVDLHVMHKRLEGGADTLFDITNSIVDSARWKAVLHPFQTSLLFLLPDVFEVASSMRDAKSSSMIKKVTFLEGLKKALRNKNSAAAYCLISLLRVARHFKHDSDSALLCYALDIQDEIREAIFCRSIPGTDSTTFDDDLITAAFVSLAHLNLEFSHQVLAPLCLAASASQDLKNAFISACCYLAKQPGSETYQPLFVKASVFIRSHLKVNNYIHTYTHTFI